MMSMFISTMKYKLSSLSLPRRLDRFFLNPSFLGPSLIRSFFYNAYASASIRTVNFFQSENDHFDINDTMIECWYLNQIKS